MKISFEDWNQNKFLLSKKDIIFIKCINCNKEHLKNGYKTYYTWKDKDISNDRLKLCPQCFQKKDKNGKILPDEITKEFKEKGFIPFETFLKYKEYNSKIKIGCICQSCDVFFIKRWDKVKATLIHNHIGEKQFCPKCIMKQLCNSNGWKKKNSDAQFISQNKLETKKRNSDGVKKAFKNDPNIKKRISESMKKRWKDPIYADLVQKRSSKDFLSGTIDNLLFASSYELSFIINCYEKNKKIERCRYIVDYENEEKEIKQYFPDFIVDEKKIYEIKGGLGDNVLNKKIAAEVFFKQKKLDYNLFFKKDLINIGCKMIYTIKELKNIRKKYGRRIKFYKIPKNWKISFIQDTRKKRKNI